MKAEAGGSPGWFVVAITILTVSSFALLVFPDPPVKASESLSEDRDGYICVDSHPPDPRAEFNWVNATRGVHLSRIEYNYHGDQKDFYQTYYLPFGFEFYGNTYNKIDVMAHGTLFPGSKNYNSYYVTQIPYQYGPNGFIAPWQSALGAYYNLGTNGNFRVYALEGETWGERWVCFQWDKAYHRNYADQPGYEVTFQAILYESGMIKFQYLDVQTTYPNYSGGGYSVVGIESPDGSTGIQYSYMENKLHNGLAVMFGKRTCEIDSVEMSVPPGSTLYAMGDIYSVEVAIHHPIHNNLIKQGSIIFGSDLARVDFRRMKSGSFDFMESDQNDLVNVDIGRCGRRIKGGRLVVDVEFTPTFNYPNPAYQNLKISVYGASVMPACVIKEDIFRVVTELDLTGTLEAHSESKGFISNGGWVYGGEEFVFQGLKAVYPGTRRSPMSGTYSILAEDESGIIWSQGEVAEGDIHLPVTVENDLVTKVYRVYFGGIPLSEDLSEVPLYEIKVDPFKPKPPENLEIHADSYEDPTTSFDDDSEVFVTWDSAEDLESGIAGYYLSSVSPEADHSDAAIYEFVEHPLTSRKLFMTGDGDKKLYIWAVDLAGNPSTAVFTVVKVDKTPVTYSEFSPGDQVWVNTRRPVCSVLISDGEGSGVSARDVEYSVATRSRYEFGPWIKVSGIRNAPEVRLSVRASFVDGKNNYIRFRAKDGAGNGWTYSPEYNVWVDEEAPSFTNFRPYEGDYQNGRVIVVSVDITDEHAGREGSGVVPSSVEYRYSTAGAGLFGDWIEAPVKSYEGGVARISMGREFSEGDSNYIQFRCNDDVGNYATSREYNVKVNSAPIVEASISDPVNGRVYTTDEKIFFDASDSEDLDGDILDFEWYSDIDGFLSSEGSTFRSLSPGLHEITLVVNDPAHSVVRTFEVLVKQRSQIDPTTIDSDGDGLYDAWEEAYGLDPERPDAFYDSDFDGFSNMQEFQNMTAPDDSNSHPPYALVVESDDDDDEGDDLSDQYLILVLLLIGISLIVIVVLALLFISKRSSFFEDVEEEKELEKMGSRAIGRERMRRW